MADSIFKNWQFLDPEKEAENELRDIAEEVRGLRLSEVLEHHGVHVEIDTGSEKKALCPFHMDNTIGSFSINDAKGICKCFACGGGGDAVHSMMQLNDMSYKDALLQLAADEQIISKEKFKELSQKEYSDEFIKGMEGPAERMTSVKKSKIIESGEQKRRNVVYQIIKDVCGLKKEHEKYLREKRALSDVRIKKDYFSISNGKFKKVIKTVREQCPEYLDDLQTLPGFFTDIDYEFRGNEKVKKEKLYWSVSDGIGILIRDAYDNIKAIQIRRDHIEEGECRYVWFSSAFAMARGNKYTKGGGTVGAPIDVLFPQREKSNTTLCVAEGRFKTEILSQWGNVALSVQGVGNYSGIDDDIKNVIDVTGKKFDSIFVFYDADMLRNSAVFAQAMKLGQYLNQTMPELTVKYCIWPEYLGKGIDDMYLSNPDNVSQIKTFDEKYLTDIWSKEVLDIFAKLGIQSAAKADKETREKFANELEMRLSHYLFGGQTAA